MIAMRNIQKHFILFVFLVLATTNISAKNPLIILNQKNVDTFSNLNVEDFTSNCNASFSADSEVCLGESITFTDESTPSVNQVVDSWFWDFGVDASPSSVTTQGPHGIVYNTPGAKTMSLTITDSDGCTHTETMTITVNPLPTVNIIAPNSGEENQTITIEGVGANIVSWEWDFGNNSIPSTVVGAGPHSVIYNVPGNKTITITIIDGNGCENVMTQNITISPISSCNAYISSDTEVCQGEPTIFSDISIPSIGSDLISWSWDFGAGAAPSAANTQGPHNIAYSTPGIKTIELSIVDAAGCQSTTTTTIMVNPLPTVNIIAPNSGEANQDITIEGVGTNIVSWEWDFGAQSNPSAVIGQGPHSIVYSQSGIKTITLTIEDFNGCVNEITQEIIISPGEPCNATISSEAVAFQGEAVEFSSASSPSTGSFITDWTWNFGSDATPAISNGPGPHDVIYSTIGIKTIELTIVDAAGCQSTTTTTIEIIPSGPKQIIGTVFADENLDCALQSEEATIAQARVRIQNSDFELETITNADGNYNVYVPEGTYIVEAYIDEVWQACPGISVTTTDEEIVLVNLGLQAAYDCEAMFVNITTPLVLYCFDTQYYVDYANRGTLNIENAIIEVELDPGLTYNSSSIVPTSISGNLLTFELGNLSIGEAGSFTILADVGCNSDGVEFGQTHCATATAFPQNDCQDPAPEWDGSSIEITGECIDDEVIFTITNNGTDMTMSAEFIVIEDELIMIQDPIQLPGGEFTTIPFTSNGSTYRAVVEQSEGHPGMSMPTQAVEGCGTNAVGDITLGYVTMFPEDDADDFISISCVENRGSYDPNDKSALPKGALDAHFIEQNVDLTYLIRFQNTGTFTAFNVVVLDTLSPHVDANKIQLGASSHDYTLNIREGNILEFNFADIMLPDSTMDLAGSNGFVEFRIPQQVDVPLETVIENTAAIYFDFNEAVITNTVFHTVGKDFLEVVLDVENDISEQIKLKVAPNPVSETAIFKFGDYQAQNGHFVLTDVTGKLVSQSQFVGNTFTFERNDLSAGIYFFEIMDENLILKSGKLVIN